ncbi:MAG: hypothetical protein M3P85_03095 [Actinomycetota bacterium]|nr:hypothetical protein [Actinomycetota bacterium]
MHRHQELGPPVRNPIGVELPQVTAVEAAEELAICERLEPIPLAAEDGSIASSAPFTSDIALT